MRLDEEYVKNAVVAFLNTEFEEINATEGDDPPDYNLQCDGKKYYLEVTQCKPLISAEQGFTNAETYNTSVRRLVNKLNDKYGSAIDSDFCINLMIQYPIENFDKFSKSLESEISELSHEKIETDFAFIRDVAGEKVRFIKHLRPYGKRINAWIGAKPGFHEINIDFHVQDMLTKAIEQKKGKLERLDKTGVSEVWLGIYNDYFLADHSNYDHALSKLQIPAVINRIFIIDPTSSIVYSYVNHHQSPTQEVN